MKYSNRGMERLGQLLDAIAIKLLIPPENLPLPHTTLDRAIQRAESIARRLFLLPQLPSSMATVTTSIGVARDYSFPSSWEADLDNGGLYSSGDDAIGELYNDSVFTITNPIEIDGGGTVGLNSITLSAASGERHDGTAGSGARISDTSSAAPYHTLSLTVDGIDKAVEWIEATRTSSTSLGFVETGALTANTTLKVQNCILHDLGATTNSAPAGINFANVSGSTWHVTNNIIYDVDHTRNNTNVPAGIKVLGVGTGSAIANNTVHNITKNTGSGDANCYAVNDDADMALQNNIGTDAIANGGGTGACFAPSSYASATCSHNLSSDATASGTGSLTSKAASNQFVSTTGGSEDLHLKTGADAIDAGTDLGTTPSGVEIDIGARDRDANADTWDIGAHEFVAAGGGGTIAAALTLLGVS